MAVFLVGDWSEICLEQADHRSIRNTMKNYLFIALLFAMAAANAQVGIGTATPKSTLDIPATNSATPANTDGILIPRINVFPGTNPTIDQNGMMVFLSATFSGKSPGFYYWDSAANIWKGVGTGTANGWGLTGNSGTNPATNFIGTTDGQDLVFRRNSVLAGKIELQQTAMGFMALSANTTGYQNTAFGSQALSANTDGQSNVAFGMEALKANIDGDANSAFGTFALRKNTTGRANTAVGEQAMQENISGSRNNAFGYQALMQNTVGGDNEAIGYGSLLYNVAASKNVAVGRYALYSQSFTNGGVAFDTNNVGVGFESLYSNNPASTTDGAQNTAIGNQAMRSNTTGFDNTSIGYRALFANTIGFHNVAIGTQALENATGFNNVGIGLWTLRNNTGLDNMAFGAGALQGSGSGSGSRNTAIGMQAMGANDSGSGNISIGYASLLNNTTGSYNTVMGDQAMTTSRAASYATAIGFHAMYYANSSTITFVNTNTAVGAEAIMGSTNPVDNTGIANTSMGYQSLSGNTSGSNNTVSGNQVMRLNTTGYSNTAIGSTAMYNNNSGYSNVALGNRALVNNVTGFYNTCIGDNVYPTSSTALNNYTGLGYNVGGGGSASNMVELGNASVIAIRAQVTGITAYSDKRIKNNIQENVPGLAFINKLRPVTYNLDLHKQNEMMYRNKKDGDADWEGKYDIEKIKQTGFIAQEVAQAAQDVNYDFNGVDVPKNPENLYSVNYTSFVVPLVKAVQEQQQIIDAQKTQNEKLQQEIDALKGNQQTLEEHLKAIEDKLNK